MLDGVSRASAAVPEEGELAFEDRAIEVVDIPSLHCPGLWTIERG
jgi:hypothetical protein